MVNSDKLKELAKRWGTTLLLAAVAIFGIAHFLSEIDGLLHLPSDLREALVHASQIPEAVVAVCLIVGLIGLVFWISDALNKSRFAKGRNMTPFVRIVISIFGLVIFSVWAYSDRAKSSTSEMSHVSNPTIGDAITTNPLPRSAQVDATAVPSLLTLFMNAFRQTDMDVFGFTDINEEQLKERVYYRILYSFNSNSKYIAFYIPHSPDTKKLLYNLRGDVNDIINSVEATMDINTKDQLNSTGVHARDYVFSKTTHIFYEDNVLDLVKMGELTTYYKQADQLLQLHSNDYRLAVIDQIRLGRVPPITVAYELRGGLIQKIQP